MNHLLYYLLQVFTASGLLYGYYHFFLRNKKFHQYNRYYLLVAVVISIAIPFFNIPVYFSADQTASSAVLQTLTGISYSTVVFSTETHSRAFTTSDVLYSIYIFFILLALTKVIISLIRIRKLSRNNPVEKIDNIFFVNTGEPGTPFSFFRWLFWDKKIDLDTDKGQQIFRHELFHIRQKHSIDIMFIELTTILFWINPFYHLIKKEIKAIHEFLADQSAVNENEEWDYAELLLMQMMETKHSLVNPFFQNQIKRRIAMITSSKKPSYQYLRKMMVLPLLAIVTMLFAFTYKKINEPEKRLIVEIPQQPFTDTIPKKKIVLDVIERKKQKNTKTVLITGRKLENATNNPLIIIDGVVQPGPSGKLALENLDPNTIKSVSVLKDSAATVKYGLKAVNGVIEITTKKKVEGKLIEVPVKDTARPVGNNVKEVVVTGYPLKKLNSEKDDQEEVVITGYPSKNKVNKNDDLKEIVVVGRKINPGETAPAFRGGKEAWGRYLQKQLNPSTPVDNGAPKGVYAVKVQFIVDANGFISDLKPITNHGFGMEEEVIRILKMGPAWIPGTLDGKAIKAYQQQVVTFVIEEETPVPDKVVVTGYGSKKDDNSNAANNQSEKKLTLKEPEKSIDDAGNIYPNPATNLVQIPLSSKVAGAGLVQVLNAAGNIVSTQRPAISKGSNTISVSTTTLKPGAYLIKLTNADGSSHTYKMIKK